MENEFTHGKQYVSAYETETKKLLHYYNHFTMN